MIKEMDHIRETCKICGKIIRVGFWIPDRIWKKAIHPYYHNSAVCIDCFTVRADEKLIKWDDYIKFFPVSMNTHINSNSNIPTKISIPTGKEGTRRIAKAFNDWINNR